MDRLLEPTAPYNVFTLYDGFLNYCQNGENDLLKRDFFGHVKDNHKRISSKRLPTEKATLA